MWTHMKSGLAVVAKKENEITLRIKPNCVKYCLVIYTLLLSLGLQAQSNFVQGLIVNNAGDTLSGQIDDREWKKNPTSIKFKRNDGAVIDFKAGEINAFNIAESKEWYHSAVLGIDKTTVRDQDARDVNLRGVQVDTVFLRALVKGKLGLYYLLDEFEHGHYVAQKDGQFSELWIEVKKAVYPSAGVFTIEHYKKQLAQFAADCKTAPPTSDIKYEKKPLMDFVIKYNTCVSGAPAYVAPEARVEHAWAILLGVNYSTLRRDWGDDDVDTYDPSIKPTFGLSYEAIIPRSRQSISLYVELLYRSFEIETTAKATQLKLATMARYRVPVKGKTRPFFGAGLTNALAVGETIPTDEKGYLENGIALDAGAWRGRVGGFLRYEKANGYAHGPGLLTKFNSLYLCAWYRFH